MRLGMALALGVAYLAVGCSDDPAETSTTGGVGGGGTGGSGAGTAGSAGVAGSSVGGTAGAAGTGGVAGAGGTGGAPQDWLDVCADQATQVCERYETCWGDLMGSFYGTRADCEQSWSNYCASQWREDGTSASETSACSAALASQLGSDCVAFGLWFNNGTAEPNFPEECKFKGDAAVGDACSFGGECASGFCGRYKGTSKLCGACLAAPAIGEACPDSVCDFGASCVLGQCVELGLKDSTCDVEHPCARGYWCNAGSCADRVAVGSPCDPKSTATICEKDALCNPVTSLCEAIEPTQKVGESCWVQSDQSLVGCFDSWCQVDANGKGTCIAKKEKGESCTRYSNLLGSDSDCRWHLTCAGGTCKEVGEVISCE
ncbi:MAG: hypothetical protein KC766_29880 [Myxococcales bacterium]|nr:hypothetical protein [Myxococcales bacterium]